MAAESSCTATHDSLLLSLPRPLPGFSLVPVALQRLAFATLLATADEVIQ